MCAIPTEVVQRFAFKRKTSLSEANYLFEQLEQFLDTASGSVARPSVNIDEAWHEFVLHTKHYADYCITRYGHFIHHVPTSPLCCESGYGSGVSQSASSQSEVNLKLADCSPNDDNRCSSDCLSGGDPTTAL